ncbi:Dynein regulatory complex subunit 2 [Chamberlinius hualienensis]
MAMVGKKSTSKKKKKGGRNDLDWKLLHEKEQREKREKLLFTYLQDKIRREKCSARLNEIKLNWSWRQVLRAVKSDELLDETQRMREAWEKLVGTKNRIIQLLSETIAENEHQRRSSFEHHLFNVDRILGIQQQHLDKLDTNYTNLIDNMCQSLEENETELQRIHQRATTEFNDLVVFCNNRDEELRRQVENEFQSRKDDILNKSCEDEKVLRVNAQSTVEMLSTQLQQLLVDEREESERLRKSLEQMKKKDTDYKNEIQKHYNQIRTLQDTFKQLKQQLKVLKDEELNGFSHHQKRKAELSGHVAANRKHMEQMKLERELCLTALANFSSNAIKYLEESVKQAEKVLRWKKMCDSQTEIKGEINGELDEGEFEETTKDSPQDEDQQTQQSMTFFWRQFNQAYFDKCLLKSHHQTLLFDNLKLQALVKQYMTKVANYQAQAL